MGGAVGIEDGVDEGVGEEEEEEEAREAHLRLRNLEASVRDHEYGIWLAIAGEMGGASDCTIPKAMIWLEMGRELWSCGSRIEFWTGWA